MKQYIIIFTFSIFYLISVISLNGQCNDNAHSPFENQGWLSCNKTESTIPERGERHWIQYDLGHMYAIDSIYVWNHNVWGETGYGVKDILIDYSDDKINWESIGPFIIEKAPGSWKYKGSPGPTLENIEARYLLITVISTWDNSSSCAGFGELKINVKKPVGTKELVKLEQFKISPNPAYDWIDVTIPSDITSTRMIIYNTLGQEVSEIDISNKSNIKISIDSYNSGIYYISMMGKTNRITKSFVKVE